MMMIAAMFSFAGLVFADAGTSKPLTAGGTTSAKETAPELTANPSGDNAQVASSSALAAPPANDTCAGAIPLTLGVMQLGTTVDANNDYQTPDDSICYSGIGNQSTKANGRDVVYSFTAPAAGSYSFRARFTYPNDPIGAQNPAAYVTDSCASTGTVNCIKGANRGNNPRGTASGASNGFNQGLGMEMVDCVPMASGQTYYLVFDDVVSGLCSAPDTSHNCYRDTDCAAGSTCVLNPSVNNGSRHGVEVRVCNTESEPNDTPATANPYNTCGVLGQTHVAPAFSCKLGTRAGNLCTRSSFLPQANPDSKMICSVSGARCIADTTLGTSNCPIPGEFCQQQTDLDCDPRCDIGPNAGKICATHAFCNPGSDQGATCAGTCQAALTCVDIATQANTGTPCTPVCFGSSIPAVNGRYCNNLSATATGQCPGGGVCVTTPSIAQPTTACAIGQTCSRNYNEGDVDYYSLGVVPAGSTVFATAVAGYANDGDYRLRITTDTQTLQFDDDDGFVLDNQSAPVIAGAVANGQPTYIEVSKTQFRASSVYDLVANVRPAIGLAQLEDESGPTGNDNYYNWPGDLPYLNAINNGANNGYVRGAFAYNLDSDCFKIMVTEGDVMDWFGAANPTRAVTATANLDLPTPLYLDAAPPGPENFQWSGNAIKNTNPNAPQPSLKATSPAVTSTYVGYTAQYTGLMEVCMYSFRQLVGLGTPNFPNNWSGSFTNNCGSLPQTGPGSTTADVSVTKTGPAGPVDSGDIVQYTIKVENHGSQVAQEVSLDEVLDANLTYISLTVDDGFSGDNTGCFSLPHAGTNDAPINCINASMLPGQITTYVLTVQVNNCIGAGVQIDNFVSITSVSTDNEPSNDFSLASFTTSAPANDGCQDLLCAGGVCVLNLCTDGDTCQAGTCVSGGATDCNDNNVCTDDSCDPADGCIHDSSQNGDLCNDFTDCTDDFCDPVNGCSTAPSAPGTSCDDGDTCTNSDVCDGSGVGGCHGASVCADGNPCTLDVAAPGTCACTNPPGPAGVACEDGEPCTSGDQCDNAGGCVPGGATVCNDNDLCTTDSCTTGLGCVYAPVVCAPADQCHQAGVCNSGSGSCDYAPVADGTACDDGDSATNNDSCTAGVCAGESACNTQPKPKSEGYYKKLCKNGVPHPHGGDQLTDADAACVGQLTATFAGITTAAEICSTVYDHDSSNHDSQGPNGKECQKADRELMALALNICRDYVCLSQEVDSRCQGGNQHVLTTVAASLGTVDGILSDPGRNKTTCKDGRCLAKEINNGKGLHHTSLTLSREAGNKLRLRWESPVFDDGTGEASKYTIWRRVLNADAVWVKMADTQSLTWVDNNPGTTTWEYEVTFTIDVD